MYQLAPKSFTGYEALKTVFRGYSTFLFLSKKVSSVASIFLRFQTQNGSLAPGPFTIPVKPLPERSLSRKVCARFGHG